MVETAVTRRNRRKNSGFILETIPVLALFVDPEPTEGFQAFQTFSLDDGTELLIRRALLDRFLACMKPASITLRPLRAGVFFGFLGCFVQFSNIGLAQISDS